ncbi:MAG: phage terminase small subunit [Hespellia sp.]|nr:phage terminase small subunit [Hespellia sp.]
MPTPRGPDTDKRSEERKQAEKIYLESKGNIKLVEIAEKLKLPDNKIRKWKSMDNWEGKLHPSSGKEGKKKPVERSTKNKGSVPPKRGAPKGNQNAKGGRGNPNPKPPPDVTKHGGYSAVYWDVLDDTEKELVEEIPKDEEALLLEQIQLFSVRERRIMQAINKYRSSDQPVAISYTSRSESKRSFDNDADKELYEERQRKKVEEDKILPGHSYNVSTQTENKDQIILRLESELSNVQAKKTKAIDALAKLHLEKQRLAGGTAGNDVVRAWAEKVRAMRGDGHE